MSDSNNPSEGGTTTATDAGASNGSASTRRRGSGLSGKLLPELQKMAGDLGITGTAKMRKGELIAAIQSAQGGAAPETTQGGAGSKTTASGGSANGSAARSTTANRGRDSGDGDGDNRDQRPRDD